MMIHQQVTDQNRISQAFMLFVTLLRFTATEARKAPRWGPVARATGQREA
ncbi:MAG: hypothetical protein PHD48_10975 [Alphaproteobacteria bacterium]|nr:hypothetical protein [Alphaproteobacteria bacterium]